MISPAPAPAASPSRDMLMIVLVAMAFFMENLDATVILTALPAMARSFHTTAVGLSLGLTVYLLVLAVVVPASGWMADRFGTRTMFCAAIGIFTIASVLCGLSQNLAAFVAARILQAVGAAMMGPVGRLVVLRSTPKEGLVRAVNWMTFPGLIAPVLGPPIGGFITHFFDWRWIFYLNLPIGLIGLALALRFIPEHRAQPRPFDLTGMILNGLSLSAIVYGLEAASGAGGANWRLGLVLVAAGLAMGVFAVRHARRAAHPLIELGPLGIPTYRLSAVTAGSVMRVGLNGTVFLLPLLLQVGFGIGVLAAGLIAATAAFGDVLVKAVTTRTVRLLGFRSLLLLSGGLFAAFTAATALFGPTTSAWIMCPVLFLVGAFRSLQMTGLSALTFADVPPALMAPASSLQVMMQQVTRALGVSLMALTVTVSAHLRGAPGATAFDFKLALWLLAGMILACSLAFRRLSPDAGARVSGHKSVMRQNA